MSNVRSQKKVKFTMKIISHLLTASNITHIFLFHQKKKTMENCKKVYRLHESCNGIRPPCYVYECENEETMELFMTMPETSTLASTDGSSRIDHGYNFLYGLGVASLVVLGLTLLGFGKYGKFFVNLTSLLRLNTDQNCLNL